MVKEGNGVEVLRLHRLGTDSSLKAFADLSFAGVFIVKGFRIVEGKNGLFVGMPREKGKDGRWYKTRGDNCATTDPYKLRNAHIKFLCVGIIY